MPKIEFPQPLKQLLEDGHSDLHAPIRALADRMLWVEPVEVTWLIVTVPVAVVAPSLTV